MTNLLSFLFCRKICIVQPHPCIPNQKTVLESSRIFLFDFHQFPVASCHILHCNLVSHIIAFPVNFPPLYRFIIRVKRIEWDDFIQKLQLIKLLFRFAGNNLCNYTVGIFFRKLGIKLAFFPYVSRFPVQDRGSVFCDILAVISFNKAQDFLF